VPTDVVANVAWLAILATALVWEAVCRRSNRNWTSLKAIAFQLWLKPIGRIAYIAVWAYVGWHVFARYTVPS